MTQEEAVARAKQQAMQDKRLLYVVPYTGSQTNLHGQFAIRRTACVPVGKPYIAVSPEGNVVEAIREW